MDVLRLGAYYGRSNSPREILFEDRTRPHADNVGNGLETTAAVGLLKACHGGQTPIKGQERVTKDVVCFDAHDYDKVVDLLKLDVFEPPVAQVRIYEESVSRDYVYNYTLLLIKKKKKLCKRLRVTNCLTFQISYSYLLQLFFLLNYSLKKTYIQN